MTRFLFLMRGLLPALSILCCLFGAGARAQQAYSVAQATANAAYQNYSNTHQTTIAGYNQRVSQDQFNELLRQEIAAWTNYVAAQNVANGEAYERGVTQQLAVIDTTINAWIQYIQNLYVHRNAAAYSTDANYRSAFDQWVNVQAQAGNANVAQLREQKRQIEEHHRTVKTLTDHPAVTRGGGNATCSRGEFWNDVQCAMNPSR